MEKAHWLFKDWKFVPFTKELPKYVAELSKEEIAYICKVAFEKALKMTGISNVNLEFKALPEFIARADPKTRTIYVTENIDTIKYGYWTYFDIFAGELNFENFVLRLMLHELGHIHIPFPDYYRFIQLQEEGWSANYLSEKAAEEFAQRFMYDVSYYAYSLGKDIRTSKDKEDYEITTSRMIEGG